MFRHCLHKVQSQRENHESWQIRFLIDFWTKTKWAEEWKTFPDEDRLGFVRLYHTKDSQFCAEGCALYLPHSTPRSYSLPRHRLARSRTSPCPRSGSRGSAAFRGPRVHSGPRPRAACGCYLDPAGTRAEAMRADSSSSTQLHKEAPEPTAWAETASQTHYSQQQSMNPSFWPLGCNDSL